MTFILLFALLSGCFLSCLVGFYGRYKNLGFAFSFLLSLIFTPLVGFIMALISGDREDGEAGDVGCIGFIMGLLGFICLAVFILLLLGIVGNMVV